MEGLARECLNSWDWQVSKIEETNTPTPDWLATKGSELVLIEEKSRDSGWGSPSHTETRGEVELSVHYASAERTRAHYSTGQHAAKQLSHGPHRADYRILWINLQEPQVERQELQWRQAIVGEQKVFAIDEGFFDVYFFHESILFSQAQNIDGVVLCKVTDVVAATFFPNPFSERFQALSGSQLVRDFGQGAEFAVDSACSKDTGKLLHSGKNNRRDIDETLRFLRSKYNLNSVQAFQMGYHAAVASVGFNN